MPQVAKLKNHCIKFLLFCLENQQSNDQIVRQLFCNPFCLVHCSSTKGAVVSDSANLLVSQDFFADLVLPYSVKRGEIFPLNVSVFNNVEVQLPIQLTIQNSDDFKIGNPVHNVCLPAGDNQLHSYTVKAKELNQVKKFP